MPDLIAQHETWISLDPVQGCPAACSYCYLGPINLTKTSPQVLVEPATLYDQLLSSPYLDKKRLGTSTAARYYPICVGNYTDMCLTPTNRKYLIELLQEHQQRLPDQPLCVITKAVLSKKFLAEVAAVGVQVVFFISLSFLPKAYERGTPLGDQRLVNFQRIAEHDSLQAVHFWRPITLLSAPSPSDIRQQLETVIMHGAKLSIVTGLKYGNRLKSEFSNPDHPLHNYYMQHYEQTGLTNEIFDPVLKRALIESATELDYPVYFHTSCALSYLWSQPDFNATFRPPHLEPICKNSYCPTKQRVICNSYRERYPTPDIGTLSEIAHEVGVSTDEVVFDSEQGIINVPTTLTQAQQTYLTQATRFTVRGSALVNTLEWVGSIHRKET